MDEYGCFKDDVVMDAIFAKYLCDANSKYFLMMVVLYLECVAKDLNNNFFINSVKSFEK